MLKVFSRVFKNWQILHLGPSQSPNLPLAGQLSSALVLKDEQLNFPRPSVSLFYQTNGLDRGRVCENRESERRRPGIGIVLGERQVGYRRKYRLVAATVQTCSAFNSAGPPRPE